MQIKKGKWQLLLVAVVSVLLAVVFSIGVVAPGVVSAVFAPVNIVYDRVSQAISGAANQVAFFTSASDVTSDSNLYWDNTRKFLGIGTSNPLTQLYLYSSTEYRPLTIDISGTGPLTAQWNNYWTGGSGSGSGFVGRFARGTSAAPANVQVGDRLGFNVFGGYAGDWRHTAAIDVLVDTGTVSGTSLPTYMKFSTTSNGAVVRAERMRIAANGKVGINTTTPDTASMLEVVTDNQTYPNVSVYGRTTGGNTYGVGGTNDDLGSLGYVGGSYNQTGTNYGVGAFGSNILSSTSGSLGTPNEGVYGYQGSGTYAAYFLGDVYDNGTLSAKTKLFKIDHPLDPVNKYLQHASVESPNMMNMYNGSIVLDGTGKAEVVLPSYFEALNRDFQYQLTCIGGKGLVWVDKEITNNRFTIAGDTPGRKVSWQVTGIRHDTWADANPLQVEVEKPKPAASVLKPSFGSGKQGWADWSDKTPAMSK